MSSLLKVIAGSGIFDQSLINVIFTVFGTADASQKCGVRIVKFTFQGMICTFFEKGIRIPINSERFAFACGYILDNRAIQKCSKLLFTLQLPGTKKASQYNPCLVHGAFS